MSDKKETRKKVVVLLENALAELKAELGEKKFAKRIEKAAKLITEGLEDEKGEKSKKEKAPKPEAAETPKAVKAPKAKAKVAKVKAPKAKQPVAKKKAKAAAKK